MTVRYFNPTAVPPPTGAYSLVGQVPPGGSIVWLAGQTGRRQDGRFPLSVRDQTFAALDAVSALVAEIGSSTRDIVVLRSYVVGQENVSEFRSARDERLRAWYPDGEYPVSTVLVVTGLANAAALVEVEAIVCVPPAPEQPEDHSTRPLDVK